MEAMDIENQIYKLNQKTKPIIPTLSNGDTVKTLLAKKPLFTL
jgi:hypothetical protein